MNVPVMNVKFNNPKRNKILSFVAENGQVSKKAFVDFLNKMNEEEGTNVSWNYVKSNAYFFKIRESKETGEKFVTLSKIGQNVLRKTTVNECATFEEVMDEDFSDILIKRLSIRMGIDISEIDVTQIKVGMAMTIENNGDGNEHYNVLGLDMEKIFSIVIGNLVKDKNYYLKLSQNDFGSWPNNQEDATDDRSTEEYNELFGKQDGPEDMLCNSVEESAATANYDEQIEKIAGAHLVRKEQVEKEFELGVSIESKNISEDGRVKSLVLEHLAANVSYYSRYAMNNWEKLNDKEKRLAQELGVMVPAFVDPMPVSPEPKPDKPKSDDNLSAPSASIENNTMTPVATMAESEEIVSSVVEDDDDDDEEDDDREEWEPENTGEEQPLLDAEKRETLLSKEQQIEIGNYKKEHGKISNEKMKEFADKFKIKKSTLEAYLEINDDVKESYEIGKRYTINGHTGIVLAVSENSVVMSRHGKMLLLEREDFDEFC